VNDVVLSEVKNVKYQGWTQQLQDYSDIAKREKLRFDLYLQKDAKISMNLVKASREGKVNIIDFD
jgi:predicted DNA binding CopG/RHH family protein